MCGISGYIGDFPTDLISHMNRSISHRGPDHSGVERFDFGAVGHVRLSIIDLTSASNQPFISDCGRYFIVYNGEIYNFLDLRRKLELSGESFRSSGDAEVLLKLWVNQRDKCLELLDGIFAFAIVDKEEATISLVRDQFGIKPLYYSQCDEGIIFSSEIKSILQHVGVSRQLNRTAIARTLCFLWSPGSETVLENVKKVLPGEMIVLQKSGPIERNKYFSPPSYKPLLNKRESVTRLRKVMKDSVESQLLADVEIGAFLSGGLDSSLICAIAKDSRPDFKSVFSVSASSQDNYQKEFVDDLPYAEKVAGMLDLNLNLVSTDVDMVSSLPEALFYLDEPQADPAILNAFSICQLASQKGIKVLLSGAGGDDLYSGYRRHYALKLATRLDWVPDPLRKAVAFFSGLFSTTHRFGRKLAKFSRMLELDENERVLELFSWADQETVKALFRKGSGEEVLEINSVFRAHIETSNVNSIEKCLLLDRDFFLVDHNLNYTDKMSMAHGVEVRVPFVGHRHVDLAAKIPTKIKQSGATGKWVLKKAAEKWLSKDIIYRPKTGFGAPLRGWITGPLDTMVSTLLSEEAVMKRGLFEYSAIKAMIEGNRDGRGDFAYTIYALLSLEIWLRQFVDPETPKQLNFEELIG